MVLLFATLAGCSTYSGSRYSISVDNIMELKSLGANKISVKKFTSSKPGLNKLMCRAVGPIPTPDGESFAEYIRKALIDEIKMAGLFSLQSKIFLSGNLDNISFDSLSGVWFMDLTVNSSNGMILTVHEEYKYKTNFGGDAACQQTAQAFMPAVQNLIKKLVTNPDFQQMLQE